MHTTLDRVREGQTVTVVRVDTPPALRARLADFGLITGTRVSCRYRSPRADVTAIAFRGSVFALRTRDLAHIWVEN